MKAVRNRTEAKVGRSLRSLHRLSPLWVLILSLDLVACRSSSEKLVAERCHEIWVAVSDRGINEKEFMRHCGPLMEPVVAQCGSEPLPPKCRAIFAEVNQELFLKTACMTTAAGCPEYGVKGRWP